MPFEITIKIGNETYTGKGANALEALLSIKRPLKIMNKGIVTLKQGDKKKELLYMPAKMKQLFYPNAQVIQAKNLAFLLK